MTIGDYIDVAHPRSKVLKATHGVTKLFVVYVATSMSRLCFKQITFVSKGAKDASSSLVERFDLFRVGAIDPGVDDVNLKRRVVF